MRENERTKKGMKLPYKSERTESFYDNARDFGDARDRPLRLNSILIKPALESG